MAHRDPPRVAATLLLVIKRWQQVANAILDLLLDLLLETALEQQITAKGSRVLNSLVYNLHLALLLAEG